nr:uncharacterized mitochondrial protein AtMg00810-like [Tanacetum cinerariifolium]
MDVKSAFLYGTIDEEVYMMQPPRFQDPAFPVKVYKVEKAMYGLHQAPRAWYGTLSKYLLKNGFQRGTIDQTLFIRRQREDFILVQVYVDDIIFGSSNPQLSREFEALMHEKFQMSAIGDIHKKFRFSDVRSSNTPMDKENPWGKDGTRKDVELYLYRSMIGSLMYLTASRPDSMFASHPKLGIWYPKASPFDLVAYSDSDYGGASQDRKSTTGGSQFLGRRLISWQCKKQTIVATLTTEAEYVATASCCGQVLWIQNQLLDYGLWYPKASPFDLVAYSDSDYGGASQDRKSTTGGSQFLGRRLISWKCKKQTIIATSTTEAEYVTAASYYGQVMWIQNLLLDYGLSMSCEALSKEISISILCLIHTARTFDVVWIWLDGDYGNVFLNGF